MRPLGMHSQGLSDNSCALNGHEKATTSLVAATDMKRLLRTTTCGCSGY